MFGPLVLADMRQSSPCLDLMSAIVLTTSCDGLLSARFSTPLPAYRTSSKDPIPLPISCITASPLTLTRGYAERSRMARTWDPGSIFHSEGAGRRHVADPKVSKKDWNGRKTWDGAMFPRGFCGPGSSNLQKRHRRNRPSLDAHHPVEMDWNEVRIGLRCLDLRRYLRQGLYDALGVHILVVSR